MTICVTAVCVYIVYKLSSLQFTNYINLSFLKLKCTKYINNDIYPILPYYILDSTHHNDHIYKDNISHCWRFYSSCFGNLKVFGGEGLSGTSDEMLINLLVDSVLVRPT